MQLRQPESRGASRQLQTIVQLARDASIELNVQDLKDLDASRAFLSHGKRVYISHLPKQRWDDTWVACQKVHAAGFDPIPHIPVRLIESEAALDRILEHTVCAQVKELLLISGDYPNPAGPYSTVADVLRAGKLHQHGLKRVSFAGHPEGHPTVPIEEIRRSELEKAALAEQVGIEMTFVTQFFFEAAPFLRWASDLRVQEVGRARLVAGLSGPAGVATLLKFARRCGVGPSIRALVARPSAFAKLIGEHGPEEVVRDLASAYAADASTFSGLHFFCFGGYLRTCEWLNKVAAGRILLSEHGFAVE
jgi:methylenetetrahydrofolate reductase (NADPH)